MERSASLRNGTASRAPPPPQAVSRPPPPPAASIDLFGDEPARPSTTEPAIQARPPPARAPAAPPKQTKPGDSLLGLDFFGSSQSAPPQRPASVASGVSSSGASQRTDLKQSILSLYAAPRAAQQPQQQQQQQSNAFGGLASPTQQAPSQSNSQALAGLNDAFGGLNFSSPPPQQQQAAKPSPFASLASPRSSMASPTSSLSGGSFFDSKPAPISKTNPTPPSRPATQRQISAGFGDFGDFTSAAPTTTRSPPAHAATSSMGDLFSMNASAPTPAAKPAPAAPSYNATAFNLSQPAPAAPKPATNPPAVMSGGFSSLGNVDVWGSNDAWSAPDPSPAPAPISARSTPAPAPVAKAPTPKPTYKAPATTSMSDDFGGWGSNDGVGSSTSGFGGESNKAAVADDDDFGGWSSAEPVAAPAKSQAGQQGNADDLFGNVWG